MSFLASFGTRTGLRALAGGCDAVLIGLGMQSEAPSTALAVALLGADASLILDATALSGLGAHAVTVRARGRRAVIAPHAGVMARFLDRRREAVKADPLSAARAAAELLGSVVVMKGTATWIVVPQGGRLL